MEWKRLSGRYKNSKLKYYLKAIFRDRLQFLINVNKIQDLLNDPVLNDKSDLQKRIDYYNQMNENSDLGKEAFPISDFRIGKKLKTYYFDLKQYTNYFPSHLKINTLFGDICYVPEVPCIQKSRPIQGDLSNAVVFPLNKIRHFLFIKNDKLSFTKKKDQLVWRAKIHPSQPHRIAFAEKYYGHSLCNIGRVNNNDLDARWLKNRMTIGQQLHYKFILCLEGNDVATNLKWVMSSNSIAVMPKPKYESWFMEGVLIPDVHYICIKDDYSNLEEKLKTFIENPSKAEKMLEAAHRHVVQFQDPKKEDYVALKVLEKYFKRSAQL